VEARLIGIDRRLARGLAAVLATVLCATAAAQWVKSPQDLQREGAQKWEPAQVRLWIRRAPGEPRVVRLRVYAAEDYRKQTFEWESRFRRMIGRVNKAVEYWPGVRFEIESVRPWARTSGEASLEELLAELRRVDDGSEVDRVLGLVAAVKMVPVQLDHIGMAMMPGRHMVIRSLHDLAEYEVVRQYFDELYPVERDRLLSMRKAHKEVVVFLHEWAHTLGIIHSKRSVRVMNPAYDHHQAEMSETEARMVEAALRAGNDRAALARELLAIATDAPDPEWDPRDREVLRASLQAAPAKPTEPRREVEPALPDAVHALLDDHDELRKLRKDDDAEDKLRAAEAAMRAAKIGKASWNRVASAWAALSAPSAAVAAAEYADRYAAEAMKSWSIGARHRFALPFDSAERGLPVEREGRYARAFLAGMAGLAEPSTRAVAERTANELARDYPRMPAAKILRCGLLVRGKSYARAEAACAEAYAAQQDAIPTLRLLAELARGRHKAKQAVEWDARAEELER
jgi:hypothetical protein